MDKKQDIKYCFGLSQKRCGSDTFDSVEELVEYAKECYNDPDGDYWDEDMDDYSEVIFIGVAHFHKPSDFAPSLDNIADQMTDQFYCENNIDDDDEVKVINRKEAEEAWKEFVEKYFDIPCTMTATWIGKYDVKEMRWVEEYGNKEE